jgi:hypothetical protein
MSASGVASMAFANTGFVLLCKISSEMLPPGGNDLIEVLKDYLAHLAAQTRRSSVFKILDDIETVRVQLILALGISLCGMYMALDSQFRYKDLWLTQRNTITGL